MKFALAQINSTTTVADNLDKVRNYTHRAAEAGANFVVFPEATMSAFGPGLREVAEANTRSLLANRYGPVGSRGRYHRHRG